MLRSISSTRPCDLLGQQVGAALRLADDQLRFVLRRRLHLVGQLLRRHQRVAQRVLALAMLDQQRLAARQVLAQPIDLAQRALVVVGRLGQERHDLGLVEAAHRGAEARLPHVERGDAHHARRRRRAVRGRRGRARVAVRRSWNSRLPLAEDRGADPHDRRAFFDRRLVVVAHAHRQLPQRVAARRRRRAAGRGTRAAGRTRARVCSGSSFHGGTSIRPVSRACRGATAAARTIALGLVGRRAELGRLAGEVDLHEQLERPASARARPRASSSLLRAARPSRPTGCMRTPAPPFAPCSTGGGR